MHNKLSYSVIKLKLFNNKNGKNFCYKTFGVAWQFKKPLYNLAAKCMQMDGVDKIERICLFYGHCGVVCCALLQLFVGVEK